METIVGIDNTKRTFRNPIVTIGNFDGVHLGHQALFRTVRQWSEELDGESLVVTFHPHPLQVLRPGNGPHFITPHDRKLELIAHCGIDATIVVVFSKEFAQISAHEFVTDLLVGRLGIKGVVVGYDYRFGRNREGNIDFLKELGEEHGFAVRTVTGIEKDGVVVSSTLIRQLVQEGRMSEAGSLLGRPYEISGTVVKGRDRGARLLGFPTANVRFPEQAPPKLGVYVVEAEVQGKSFGGAANIGYNPTFGDTELSLEVHLFGFSENIYQQPIRIRFLERLRDEKKFRNPQELTEQIGKDIERAKLFLSERTTHS